MNDNLMRRPWFHLGRHEDPPKPDDKKPDDKKPDEPKPDDKKPDEPKPDDKKPEYPDGLGDAGKKALDAERAARKVAEDAAKAAKTASDELAARLKVIEDKDKSELELAKEAATKATERADAAEREALRLKVVADTKVPAELAEFVVGDTEQAMRDAAAKLTKALGEAKPGKPAPDPGQGGGNPPGDTDFRTADAKDVRAELRKRGVRTG